MSSEKTENRTCQNCKKDFTIEPDDFGFYEKIKVPPPTFCSECRLRRRIIWRNERSLYKNNCLFCKKSILSIYSLDSKSKVFCPECWWGDNWSPTDYAKDYDFSKSFFEQFAELMYAVPSPSLQIKNSLNSPFANYLADSKNVYMSFSTTKNSENIFYSKNTDQSSWVVDSFFSSNCQNCFFNISGDKNYNSIFLHDSKNCIDSFFLFDCINCQNCFLSSNLRNKNYYIKNKAYSKEDYFSEIKKYNLGSFNNQKNLISEFEELKVKSISKYANIVNCVGSTGNDLRNSKNAQISFDGYDFENVKFVLRSYYVKDSMDITNLGRSELVYEFMAMGGEGSQSISFIVNGLSALRNVRY